MLEGYDISVYQATTPPLAGKAFCFARAGYGSGSIDGRYAYHAANIRKAGVVLGAYWFLYLGQDNTLAVKTFLATAGSADLLVLDVEGGANNATGYALATDFIAKVHAAGRTIGLYHSLSGFPHLGQDFDWVALWSSSAPPIPWTFWQYGGSGVDADRFNGDAAALAALVGGTHDVISTLDAGTLVTAGNPTRIYPEPNGAPLGSTIAAGTTLTKLGGISGWRKAVVNLGGVPHEVWLRADEIKNEVSDPGLQTAIVAGHIATSPTPDQVTAEILAARQAQYDADLAAANADPVNIGPRP